MIEIAIDPKKKMPCECGGEMTFRNMIKTELIYRCRKCKLLKAVKFKEEIQNDDIDEKKPKFSSY